MKKNLLVGKSVITLRRFKTINLLNTMKKTLLSLIALVAIAVACGSKYPAEMTTLVDKTIAQYDSVQTMEQYEQVNVAYLTAAQEIVAKYGENFSEADQQVVSDLSAKLTPAIEQALQRAQAAQAAAMAADTTVVVEEVVEVK